MMHMKNPFSISHKIPFLQGTACGYEKTGFPIGTRSTTKYNSPIFCTINLFILLYLCTLENSLDRDIVF